MKPERWQQIDRVFQAALEYQPDERAAFLDEACAGDPNLRREVEALLACDAEAETFIETPALKEASDLLAEQADSMVGQVIGPYKILGPLGAGGMGEVYLAQDARLGRRVALKLLPACFTRDEAKVRRFVQEARAASALNHPNIITIYEIGQAEGIHFIVGEFVDGCTLRELLSRRQMTLTEALDIAIQAANALQAAHEAGIVHRDVKPENLMLRRDGYVKVLDFGLAKLTEPQGVESDASAPAIGALKTNAGVVMGTANYMSPEQARGLAVDERTDIFSLGVVIYEMIAGRAPFEGQTASDVIASILSREPPPLARHSREVPETLERIITKALRKDTQERYQTARELVTDLRLLKHRSEVERELELSRPPEPGRGQPIIDTAGERAVPSSGVAQDTTSSAGYLLTRVMRHRAAFAVVALAILGLAVAGVYFLGERGRSIESVAVLPFVNLGADTDTEYLADGITESLINSLTQLPKLRVTARSMVFRYKGHAVDPQTVGRNLQVGAVVTGRLVQRDGNLNVQTELVDVANGSQIWGKQYDRKLSDLLALHEEITNEIIERLLLRLSPREEKKRLIRRYTDNAEAYQLYLKGRYYFDKRTAEGVRQSIGYFQEAIKKDPNYAIAYAGLANSYNPSDLVLPPRETMTKAKTAAARALELDASLPEAHTAQARVLLFYDWDWLGAESELKRAIELNPNYGEAHHMYSHCLMPMGRTEESIAEARRALDLDPLDVLLNVHLGWAYLYGRKYESAIEQLHKSIDMDANFDSPHILLGRAYALRRMYGKAIAELQRAMHLSGGTGGIPVASLGYAYAVSGKRDEAIRVLDSLKALYKQSKCSPYDIAMIHTGLGDNERALEWLEKAYEERTGGLLLLNVEPIFDNLRSDPRFVKLTRRLGLVM